MLSEASVLQELRGVLDPELGVNVVDLGLVAEVRVHADGVRVQLGATSPACPMAPAMRSQAESVLRALPGLQSVEVVAAEDFHWTPDLMSEAARARLQPGSIAAAMQAGAPDGFPSLAEPAAATGGVGPVAIPLFAAGGLSLMVALYAGLIRIGWDWSIPRAEWAAFHGALMVCGFLGTLIGLERSVGLGRRWALAVPAATAVGALTLLFGNVSPAQPLLFSAGSLGLTVVFLVTLRTQPGLALATMCLGALCWFTGNVVWLWQGAVASAVPWWMAFLTLTIAGERLELSRFTDPSVHVTRAFVGAVLTVLAGCAVSLLSLQVGTGILSVGLFALGAWLVGFDVARRTVRQDGLTRFTAVSLLVGYAWLLVTGIITVVPGLASAGFARDAQLHAFFLGFVMSMIFGHAPIIFPTVIGRPIRFRKAFYVHLALLHAGLVMRIAGDWLVHDELRRCGGLIGALAILVFLANTVRSVGRPAQPGRA